MTKQVINIGVIDNDGSGEGIRTAFKKVNNNFDELYPKVDRSSNVANAAIITSNAAFNRANAAYAAANSGWSTANAANSYASSALSIVNQLQTTSIANFNKTNAAFAVANTAAFAYGAANLAWQTANSKLSTSGGTISGDLVIDGNLYMTGSTTLINVASYEVSDPLLYLAGNNYVSDIVDIGFVGNYVNATGQNVHTGIFRDATTKEYYVFHGYDKEPDDNVIDPNGNNFTLSVLNATIRTSNLILAGVNAMSRIGSSHSQANAAFVQANTAYTRANSVANVTISYIIDGDGAVVTTGSKKYLGPLNFGGTIRSATVLADQAGNTEIIIRKCTYSQFDAGATHPVDADKITASSPLRLNYATKNTDITLSGWTTTFSSGDIFEFYVNSASTLTWAEVVLDVVKE